MGTHIYVLDQGGNIVAMQNLDPNGVDVASISFTIPSTATSLTAYEFCNLHGLWQGPTVFVNVPDDDGQPSNVYVLWGAIATAAASVFVSCICASWFYVRYRNAQANADLAPKNISPVASPKRLDMAIESVLA